MALSLFEQLMGLDLRGGDTQVGGGSNNASQSEASQALMNTTASAPREYGTFQQGAPSMEDLNAWSYTDAMTQQGLDRRDTADRRAALFGMQGGIDKLSGTRNEERGNLTRRGDAAWDTAARISDKAADARFAGQSRLQGVETMLTDRSNDSIGQINSALENLKATWGEFAGQLSSDRGSLDRMVNTVWDTGAKAVSEFRSTIGQQMGAWLTGNQQQTRALKTQTANQLIAAGYRPDEVEAQLRKMDIESAQMQAGKVAEYGFMEEQGRRQLQLAYDTLGSQAEGVAAEARTQLTTVEGNFRQFVSNMEMSGAQSIGAINQWATDNYAAIQSAKNGLDQWEAEYYKTGQLSALDTQTQYELAGANFTASQSALEMTGLTSLASLWQTFESSFTPLSYYLSDDFNRRMAVQLAYFGDTGMLNSYVANANAGGAAQAQNLGYTVQQPMG